MSAINIEGIVQRARRYGGNTVTGRAERISLAKQLVATLSHTLGAGTIVSLYLVVPILIALRKFLPNLPITVGMAFIALVFGEVAIVTVLIKTTRRQMVVPTHLLITASETSPAQGTILCPDLVTNEIVPEVSWSAVPALSAAALSPAPVRAATSGPLDRPIRRIRARYAAGLRLPKLSLRTKAPARGGWAAIILLLSLSVAGFVKLAPLSPVPSNNTAIATVIVPALLDGTAPTAAQAVSVATAPLPAPATPASDGGPIASVPPVASGDMPRTSPFPATDVMTGADHTANTFSDPQELFSFTLPAGWQIEQPQMTDVVALAILGPPIGNINIVTETVLRSLTLDEYVTAAIADIRAKYPSYQLGPTGIQAVALGGKPARRYDVIGVQRGTQLHFTQTIAVNEGIAYVLTFTAADKDEDLVMGQFSLISATFAFTTGDHFANTGRDR